jgi:hypothetical protein
MLTVNISVYLGDSEYKGLHALSNLITAATKLKMRRTDECWQLINYGIGGFQEIINDYSDVS